MTTFHRETSSLARDPFNDADEFCVANGIEFDNLEPIRVPVWIGRKKPEPPNYMLKEADEAAAVAYKKATLRGAIMEEGRIQGLDGVADAEPLLVSMCLFSINMDGSGQEVHRPVPLQVILAWPPARVARLHQLARKISCLDEDTVESIQEQIKRLQAVLDRKLRERNNGKANPFAPLLENTVPTSAEQSD